MDAQLSCNGSINEDTILDGINVDAIMRSIREANQRKWKLNIPDVAALQLAEKFSKEDMVLLRFLVRSLNQPSVQLELDFELTRSYLDELPLIGTLWQSVRRSLHRISLHYVRKVAGFLRLFHRHTTSTAELLLRYQEQQDELLSTLQQRVSELEARLAVLEDRL